MSFVLWIYALLSEAWRGSAHLAAFVHAIDVSIALSLAYSVILKIGNFSGKSLDQWVDREKARILGPLAEDKNFDAEGYEKGLDRCRERFRKFVHWTNIVVMAWCVIAAFGALLALILIPFHEEKIISGHVVLQNAFLLAGPVPTGMFVLAATHVIARLRMRHHSRDAEVLIRFIERKKARDLAAANRALGQAGPSGIVEKTTVWINENWPDIRLWSKRGGRALLAILVIWWFVTH